VAEPHRGRTLLTFAVVSLCMGLVPFWLIPVAGIVVGVVAAFLGNYAWKTATVDLETMHFLHPNFSPDRRTQTAHSLGRAALAVGLFSFAAAVINTLYFLLRGAFG
jgi:hypothetical protein